MAITANTGSNNWNTNAAWVGGVQPTAADDVIIPNGAALSIPNTTTVLCRSLTMTGTGSLAWFNSSTSVLAIGDGTAGAGNVAISIAGTCTITPNIGTINLVSTSTTQQTITTSGRTMPTLAFNGVGGSWILGDALNTATTVDLIFQNGTFNTANYAITGGRLNFSTGGARTVTFGSSAISATSITYGNMTGVTMTANTAVVTITTTTVSNNNIVVMNSFNWNGLSLVFSNNNQATINIQSATIGSLTINGTANQNDTYRISGNFTITGTFTVNGNSALNRPLIYSATTGTPVIITAAATSLNNVDFKDVTGAGTAAWAITSGFVGDRLGNSNITFTSAVPTTMSIAGSTNDATKWSGGRVPLPQDDVTFTGSGAITMNAFMIGKNVDFSAYTGTLTITSSGTEYELFGSVTLGSGMSFGSSPNTLILGLSGRGTHTITSNGKLFFPAGSNGTLNLRGFGGSYTLTDAFSFKNPVSAALNVLAGTFDSASYQMDIGRYVTNGAITRSNLLGSSIINLYVTTGSTFITASATGNTMDALNVTFNVMVVSSNTRSLDLGGVVIGTFNYNLAGSLGQMTAISSGYINTLNFSDATNARTLAITSGQTLSVNDLNVFGLASKLITVTSGTAGNPAYLEVIGAPAVTDYLSVKDIFGVIPNKIYAGVNSTNVSGNTNVEFTATPTGPYISRRGDVQVSNATSATAILGYGLPPTAGRKIVAFYTGTNNIAGTITPPAGFTQIGTIQGTTPWITVWEKISDGTETSLTFSKSGAAPQISGIKAYSLGGFSGTPTFDASDFNSVSAATSMSSAGSAPSNTDNPAIAIVVLAANNAMGNSVSASNGFGIMRDSTELTAIRVASKALFSNAAVSTTYTWTTARNAQSSLVIYKDVATNAGNFLPFFNV